jgi:DHA1 family tetracycline resistance protein-like MFS transporter
MDFRKNGALLTVLLIVFVDILGFTIMIPLLPFYAESLGATPFVVGMLSSIYGLCSLISGPILGDLSDRYGRRKILLLSQIGTCIGFIILALSRILWVVFLSRIIDGITAGNLTVAQAYISDVTKPQERTRAMGMIGASFGLGFILGPAISGILVQFGHAAPIWASAALSFISIIGTIVFLKDVKIRSEAKIIRSPLKYSGTKRMLQCFFYFLNKFFSLYVWSCTLL